MTRWKPLTLALALAACDPNGTNEPSGVSAGTSGQAQTAEPARSGRATPEEAKAFVARINKDLHKLWSDWQRAEWVKDTYIIEDSEMLAARGQEAVMAYASQAIKESARFDGLKLDPDTERQLKLLRLSLPLPAPNDPEKRTELATLQAKMSGIYGKGKYCGEGVNPEDPNAKCRTLDDLTRLMREDRDYDKALDAWKGWHTISPPMRTMYARYVELANEGAREIGFRDFGDMWKSGYDMSPDEFEQEVERLWTQLKPLYDQLHCYTRAKLSEKYGADKVPPDGAIPAHLLGNMWAQEWSNVYPLVEPYKDAKMDINVTAGLERLMNEKHPLKNAKDPEEKQKNQLARAHEMVRMGENFFTSLGLDPLPKSFWERSMFVRPRDRDVVCHASAWDVSYSDDLRIKMCIETNDEDLITIHHELGHDYYFHYYYKLPVLYQNGAHDGFHEGIGDTLALSVTPGYLKQLNLLRDVPKNEKALINVQMKDALDKIAFLPFGKLMDQWRWDVFSGKVGPDRYNAHWWELRKKYQGIAPAVARTENDFDPGAKYHIPANVAYTRYFLARVLQFQFHRALCRTIGHQGPLHECSIYGRKEAGDRLRAMLEMGASKPWPEALKAVSGETQMDASALVEYFAPLTAWLEKENAGKKCGW
jgi:peptidyl-dipeptidase A